MNTKRLLQIFCVVCAGLFCANTLFAGIGVEPTRIELILQADYETSGKWTITNTGEEPIRIGVEIEDWMGEGAQSPKKPDNWLKIEDNNFILKPDERKEVVYKVKITKEMDGGALAMVFFEYNNAEGPPSIIQPRFGAALYVVNKGTERLEAEITDAKLTKIKDKDNKDGIRIDVTVRNTGNVHIRPRIGVAIKDKKGRDITKTAMPYGWPVLPGRDHTYTAYVYDTKIPEGKLKVICDMKFGELFGREEIGSKEFNFKSEKDRLVGGE